MENVNQIAVADWNEGTVSTMKKVKRYTTQLQSTVPLDQLNRPLALINTTELMATGLSQPLEELLDNPNRDLYMPISYLEGIPTIYGVPIWEKLESEKLDYYNLFKRYRELLDDKGLRSIYKLHIETGIPVAYLELLRQNYFWQIRVTAFDQYRLAEREHMLKVYQDEILDRHRTTGQELFAKCTDYVIQNPQLLTPKTALQWAELAVRLERISTGLQPDKPGTISDSGPTIQIQNIQANNQNSQQSGDIDEDRQRLKQLVNVMNNIGLFEDVVEGECEEVTEDELQRN